MAVSMLVSSVVLVVEVFGREVEMYLGVVVRGWLASNA
jgi:hypothetical protein